MEISVVLATYNRAASLRATLESLATLSSPDNLSWELLVVDNNSNDSTLQVVEQFADNSSFPVRYIFERRQGKSSALNAGVAQARGRIIAFTDDDVSLHPDWLSEIKSTFERFDCAAVAGRIIPVWDQPKPDWLDMRGQFAVVNFELGDEFKEIQQPPIGANSAFRRDVFQRHGLFRLDLGPTESKHTITCEDTEFGDRLIKAGEKVVYCPRAIVYHPVDPRRATKTYVLSWYYYNGISVIRTSGLPTEGILYFGVPRWLFRELLAKIRSWLCTVNQYDRFQRKLRVWQSIGTIVECYRLSHAAVSDLSPRKLSKEPIMRS